MEDGETTSAYKRLIQIQEAICKLNDEAVALLESSSQDKKMASVHWHSTIKCATGYRNEDFYQYTMQDSIESLKNCTL